MQSEEKLLEYFFVEQSANTEISYDDPDYFLGSLLHNGHSKKQDPNPVPQVLFRLLYLSRLSNFIRYTAGRYKMLRF
jgi:hypothetical protein